MTIFHPEMTTEMIEDFKTWTRAVGGDEVMEGVVPDIRKHIQLGFCRNDFISDMEYSFLNSDMFYDPNVEDMEYDYYSWEQAKANESKGWRDMMKTYKEMSEKFAEKIIKLEEEKEFWKNGWNKEQRAHSKLQTEMKTQRRENLMKSIPVNYRIN
tara:strand:+ start:13 stop:477 length:465 start_codon:yes stop_codon:yes gene_type:complete